MVANSGPNPITTPWHLPTKLRSYPGSALVPLPFPLPKYVAWVSRTTRHPNREPIPADKLDSIITLERSLKQSPVTHRASGIRGIVAFRCLQSMGKGLIRLIEQVVGSRWTNIVGMYQVSLLAPYARHTVGRRHECSSSCGCH